VTRTVRRLTGRVEAFDPVRGWGRVASEGALYLFDASDVTDTASLRTGAAVEFIPVFGVNGRFARQIRRLDAAAPPRATNPSPATR
jgi:hypothetical protein